MVRALSKDAKCEKSRKNFEEKVVEAVTAYRAAKAEGTKGVTYRTLGELYGIPFKTIQRHFKTDQPTLSQSRAKQGRLSPEEDKVVLENVLFLAKRGVPPSQKDISRRAWSIVMARDGPNAKPIGANWADRWITRHRNELGKYWGMRIDSKRGQAVNPTSNQEWWDMTEDTFVSKDIKPWRKWGADEIGIEMGYAPRRRVVGPIGQKTQHDQGDGNREMVTVMNTICADGTYLKPFVIYKGKNILSRWGAQNNPLDAT